MAAITHCPAPIRGTRLRLTRLDTCGVPIVGTSSVITTKGFISVKLTPQYETGTETILRNAGGEIALSDKAPDILKWWDVELAMVGVNPDALEMLAGYEIIIDNATDTVGVYYGEDIQTAGTAVEVWTDIAGAGACAGGVARYGYLLAPFTTGYKVTSEVTIQNEAVNATLVGLTKRNAQWGKGPHDDVTMNGPVVTQVAGPLITDFPDDKHWLFMSTLVPPPAVTDPCKALALA